MSNEFFEIGMQDAVKLVARGKKHVDWCLIDRDRIDHVNEHSWSPSPNQRGHASIAARIDGSRVYLHRYLTGLHDDRYQVDHINRDPRDNRLINLRVVTPAENQRNQGSSISWYAGCEMWQAQVRRDGKHYSFNDVDENIAAWALHIMKSEEFYSRICEYPLVDRSRALDPAYVSDLKSRRLEFLKQIEAEMTPNLLTFWNSDRKCWVNHAIEGGGGVTDLFFTSKDEAQADAVLRWRK